ncbi:MAG: glycosyltransferase [Flavobacteriales bacterium]|nr:glycosyltransferase [Flavobacteriales bacterium]
MHKTAVSYRIKDKVRSLFGLPLISSDMMNASLMTSVYHDCNADIYCAFGLTDVAHEMSQFCLSEGKKLVLFITSDLDFDFTTTDNGKDIFNNSRSLKASTLNAAEMVFAQTKNQSEKLKSIGIKSHTLLKNPVLLPNSIRVKPKAEHVLWVGKSDNNKNPKALLEIAANLQEIKFKMVMNKSDTSLFNTILKNRTENVEIIEFATRSKMNELYQKSFALINTSLAEGFPNTLLEAATFQVPMLSLFVNPDSILTDYNIGIFANGDRKLLESEISSVVSNTSRRKKLGVNAEDYVQQHHNMTEIKRSLIKTFSKLAGE